MNVTTNAILVAMVMISVTKRVGVFTPRPGKNARQNFSVKGAQILLYWYNDHKTIFAHNRGDMHCIKSHIHFQVSPSTSEIFNKNLKIGRFYPGLPYYMYMLTCRRHVRMFYRYVDMKKRSRRQPYRKKSLNLKICFQGFRNHKI